MNNLLAKLRAAIAKNSMIPKNARVLAALSGGADSIALLHGLLALQAELGFALAAAHLHHGIRGEAADADAAFCKGLCDSWGVPFYSGRADCPGLARAQKCTLEEAARTARYDFLHQTAKTIGASRIAVAHHRDDQAETVLLNLFRGTGAMGLRGMQPVRGAVIRPLLSVTKGEILEYVRQENLPFVQDETNEDPAYSRNRLRGLDGELRQINPAYAQNIVRAAHLLGADEDALSGWAEAELRRARQGPSVLCDKVNALPQAVGTRLLRRYAASCGLESLTFRHLEAICALCAGGTGASVDLPEGFCARVEYGVLTIAQAKSETPCLDFSEPFSVEGETPTPLGIFFAEIVPRPSSLVPNEPFCCFANAEAFANAVARPRQPGDAFFPLGSPGRKKLKAFYIDKKIPRNLRALPVLAIGNDILWAVGASGAGLSQTAAVSGQPTVLRLRFDPARTNVHPFLESFDF